MSTPAARICGPPMPKIFTSARCFRAVARRAAYMSPLASPAESRRGIGGIFNFDSHCYHLIEVSGRERQKKEGINTEGSENGAQSSRRRCAGDKSRQDAVRGSGEPALRVSYR